MKEEASHSGQTCGSMNQNISKTTSEWPWSRRRWSNVCHGNGFEGPNVSDPDLDGIAEAVAEGSFNFWPVAESQSMRSRFVT